MERRSFIETFGLGGLALAATACKSTPQSRRQDLIDLLTSLEGSPYQDVTEDSQLFNISRVRTYDTTVDEVPFEEFATDPPDFVGDVSYAFVGDASYKYRSDAAEIENKIIDAATLVGNDLEQTRTTPLMEFTSENMAEHIARNLYWRLFADNSEMYESNGYDRVLHDFGPDSDLGKFCERHNLEEEGREFENNTYGAFSRSLVEQAREPRGTLILSSREQIYIENLIQVVRGLSQEEGRDATNTLKTAAQDLYSQAERAVDEAEGYISNDFVKPDQVEQSLENHRAKFLPYISLARLADDGVFDFSEKHSTLHQRWDRIEAKYIDKMKELRA